MTDSTSLSVGSYVSLSFTSEVDSSTFYLPMSYVRQENGQYYVMRESKDKKLERQNIQTGKIIDGGSAIEILSDLLVCAFDGGNNGDDRRNADDDAQHGENGTHLMGQNAL